MVSRKYIFISYRSLDFSFAIQLATVLRNAGVQVWMDKLDIKPGQDWRKSIEDSLDSESCVGLIAILSPEYISSEYCRKELARANRLEKVIFPVLLQRLDALQWPIEIETIQYIDFTNSLSDSVYKERVDSLISVIHINLREPFDTPPNAETQYLNSLIADLESRSGVLEYVELSAKADSKLEVRPEPIRGKWEASFAMLIEDEVEYQETALAANHPQFVPLKGIHQALEMHLRFVLIGAPGAGKTTTIRRLALDSARLRLETPRMVPLPLLLYLPEWEEEDTFVEFIDNRWPFNDKDASTLINSGQVVIYLDGLNEMGASGELKAGKIRSWLHPPRRKPTEEDYMQDTAQFPRRVVITCRREDYGGVLNLKLPTIMVEALNEKQVKEFVTNYLRREKAHDFWTKVSSQNYSYPQERRLLHLLDNPYLLAALIFIYETSPDGDLPSNSGTLFRRLVMALWDRERNRKTPGWMPLSEMEKVLGTLALAIIDKNMPVDVSLNWALAHSHLANKWWQQRTDEDNKNILKCLELCSKANLVEIRGTKIL